MRVNILYCHPLGLELLPSPRHALSHCIALATSVHGNHFRETDNIQISENCFPGRYTGPQLFPRSDLIKVTEKPTDLLSDLGGKTYTVVKTDSIIGRSYISD